ncbi:MAG: phosphoglucosamine mutase, partial [Candidatus Micrarchaeia archaeon]
FRQYPMIRKKYRVEDKEEVMEKVKKEIDVEGKRNENDGIRIDGEDYWVLVRQSGTEPVVRLTVEAKEKNKCEEIVKEVEKIIL